MERYDTTHLQWIFYGWSIGWLVGWTSQEGISGRWPCLFPQTRGWCGGECIITVEIWRAQFTRRHREFLEASWIYLLSSLDCLRTTRNSAPKLESIFMIKKLGKKGNCFDFLIPFLRTIGNRLNKDSRDMKVSENPQNESMTPCDNGTFESLHFITTSFLESL